MITLTHSRLGWLFLICLAWTAPGGTPPSSWRPLQGPDYLHSDFPPGMRGFVSSGNRLFAFGDSGIFASGDTGTSWARWDKGIGRHASGKLLAADSTFFVLADSLAYVCSAAGECAPVAEAPSGVSDMAVGGSRAFLLAKRKVFRVAEENGSWKAVQIGTGLAGSRIAATRTAVALNGSEPISAVGDSDIGRITTDGGASWKILATPMNRYGFSLEADAERFYAGISTGSPGFAKGYFFFSNDSGTAWDPLPKTLSGGDPIDYYKGFKVLDSGLVCVTQGGKYGDHFYISKDFGLNWISGKGNGSVVSGNRQTLFSADLSFGSINLSRDQGQHWKAYVGAASADSVTSIALTGDSLCVTVGNPLKMGCSADRGQSWLEPYGGWVGSVIGDGGKGICYWDAMSNSGRVPQGLQPSDDWSNLVYPDIFAVARQDDGMWVGFTRSPSSIQVFYQKAGASKSIYLSSGIPASTGLSLVAYAGHVLLASETGIYRLPIGGTIWAPANAAHPSRLASLASDGKRLFGVIGGRIYDSPDLGSRWDSLDAQPEGVHVQCVAIQGDTLYAGTSLGVWTASTAGMPIPFSIKAPGLRAEKGRPKVIWNFRGPLGYQRQAGQHLFDVGGKRLR